MTKLKAIPGGQSATGAEPYGFMPEFERALIYLCCANRDVFSRVGTLLDPKAIADKAAVQLLKAAQAIAEEAGEGPSTPLIAVQRLRAWREDGKITIEQVQECVDYIDAAEDAGLPAAEDVINETATLLKKRAKRDKAKKVMDTLAKGGDFGKLGAEIAAVERIGEGRNTLGDMFSVSAIDQIVASANLSKFSTGCMELDDILGGGLPKGYTMFLGREKSGKSMALSSIAAEAMWRGKNVALATLELDTAKQMARVMANLTACTIDEVESGAPVVRTRMAALDGYLGKLACQKFAPDTPVNEIIRWKEQLDAVWDVKVDLLVVDYADLVGAGKAAGDEGAYTAQKVVINTFRDHAIEHGYVVISVAQGKRGSGTGGKHLDTDDASDSQNKIRIPDLVIAMRMELDRKEDIDWFVIAARNGKDRVGTGELPATRAMGRMFPVNRQEPW